MMIKLDDWGSYCMLKPDSADFRFILDRPFHFIVVLWGKRFRDYLVDLCLPSLLSPGNLPALATAERSKLAICTRPDDWAAIAASPIFQLLQKYVDPVFCEIPPCPAGVSGCTHMGIGHRGGLEMAYQAKAYAFVLTPDSVFSDGAVRRLQDLAVAGVELALTPALRFGEEPFFNQLEQLGISPHGRGGAAQPICLDNRQLVHASLASMHSETISYEWDASYFSSTPSGVWWRVPGEDGIVLHSLSWAAPLMDMAAIRSHDTSTFDAWTFDGDYVYNNLGSSKKIHLALDSDELFIASWGPLADGAFDLRPQPILKLRLTGEVTKKARLRAWFYGGIFDPLKHEIFFRAARWHARPINDSWRAIENRALKTLYSSVSPPSGIDNILEHSDQQQRELNSLGAILRTRCLIFAEGMYIFAYLGWARLARLSNRQIDIMIDVWSHRSAISTRTKQILRGDRTAAKRAKSRILQHLHYLLSGNYKDRKSV